MIYGVLRSTPHIAPSVNGTEQPDWDLRYRSAGAPEYNKQLSRTSQRTPKVVLDVSIS